MYTVQVHKRINQIISVFYRLGLWSRGDEDTAREKRLQLFYLLFYSLFPISLITGAFSSDNRDEFVFLVEMTIIVMVLLVKVWVIISKKKQVLELLNRICVHSTKDHEVFYVVNDKLNKFMNLMTSYVTLCALTAFCIALIVPLIGSEKKLFYNIGFPVDYKNSDVAYWIAFAFLVIETFLSVGALLFSIFMWYLMINCSLRYGVLGHQIKNMGLIRSLDEKPNKRKISDLEKQNRFLCDLIAAIESHVNSKELINQLDAFLSKVFLIQLTTSGLCICSSIYCILFHDKDHFIEYLIHIVILVYNVLDIFMIMYFGNEIKLSSDRLSYCLFESDWVDQPQSTKKNMIIFGEFLRQPHELVILTLYPLTLETFTRILNNAYSMFNILKNFK